MLDLFDWYIVPIVNIDGYIYSWTNDRLWRKNRNSNTTSNIQPNPTIGADLNRNFGPEEYFALGLKLQTDETYPGKAPYSEPEVSGIHNWLQKSMNKSGTSIGLNLNIVGAMDIHTYGGLILTPFGNQQNDPQPPYNTELNNLCQAVRYSVSKSRGSRYICEAEHKLYVAIGTFQDYFFLTYSKPALTLEILATDFVVSNADVINQAVETLDGLKGFASGIAKIEVPTYTSDSIVYCPPKPYIAIAALQVLASIFLI